MQYTVKNDTPFQILTSAIVIGPSQTGYQLEVAADGKNFSPLFTVGANVTRQVTNLSSGAYYRLNGNVGDVVVNWVRSCVTEGGSGGSGATYSAGTYIDITEDVISVTGITPDLYLTSADTENFLTSADTENLVSSAQVQTQIAASISGKADAANITPIGQGNAFFPSWNSQGIITGVAQTAYYEQGKFNGGFFEYIGLGPAIKFYAPTTSGTAGEILVSTGNGAPVWSAVTMPDMSEYWTSAQTDAAIAEAVSGKADAVNIQPNTGGKFSFPRWNSQGIITGEADGRAYQNDITINGVSKSYWGRGNGNPAPFYAPLSAGTAGDILVSTGNGAPVWSAMPAGDVTKAYVDSAITGVEDHILDVERVTASALTELHQDMGSLSAVVQEQQVVFSSGYNELHTQVLELSARTAPDMSAYTPTTGFSTINGSAITNGGNLVIQGGGGDMSNYWNSAETKTYVDSAATNLQDQIDTMDEVVSAALVDLEGKKVESQDIRHMVKLTQAQYDQLATKDPETFYIIVNSN